MRGRETGTVVLVGSDPSLSLCLLFLPSSLSPLLSSLPPLSPLLSSLSLLSFASPLVARGTATPKGIDQDALLASALNASMSKVEDVVNWACGVVVSRPLSMRKALGSIPSESTFPFCQGREREGGETERQRDRGERDREREEEREERERERERGDREMERKRGERESERERGETER